MSRHKYLHMLYNAVLMCDNMKNHQWKEFLLMIFMIASAYIRISAAEDRVRQMLY